MVELIKRKRLRNILAFSAFVGLLGSIVLKMLIAPNKKEQALFLVQNNQYNAIFELPLLSQKPAGKIYTMTFVDDIPYYLLSKQLILATNGDVLCDPATNGLRRVRVYKPQVAEWKCQIHRKFSKRVFIPGAPGPVRSWKIAEWREVWTSETMRNN